MTAITRRRFVTLAGLTALGLAAGAIGWRRRELIAWLARPDVTPAPKGSLPAPVAATLAATVDALLGAPITKDAYAAYFAWRAENIPGYRALYVGYARHVDAAARRRGARDFASADLATRQRILGALSPSRRWRRLGEGVLDRDGLRWRQQVVREIYRQFARTDGFLRLGYDRYPGTPAGLAGLDAPPRGAA